ncbi:MAG: hypothetical protein A2104_05075 [Candidatus Melainabacteria bacterium GWF2_32_7]|nr:MAG: hypothetical protein A2104_05075 [Candidatus Melainabacteria bacterium GWF2_32_7]
MCSLRVYNLNDPNAYISVVRKTPNAQDLYPHYSQDLYKHSYTPTVNALFEGLYVQPFQAPGSGQPNDPQDPTDPTDPTDPNNPGNNSNNPWQVIINYIQNNIIVGNNNTINNNNNVNIDNSTDITNNIINIINSNNNNNNNNNDDAPIDPPVYADEAALTRAWGDPHFQLKLDENKKENCFDFQGKSDTVYSMLDNEDLSLNAKFSDGEDLNARYITDQNLELKGTGINVVSHKGGAYEIYNNGAQIDENDPALQQAGASVKYENSALTVDYKERQIVQKLSRNEIEDQIEVKYGDKGILSQLVGSIDNDDNKTDGVTKFNYDINKDDKVDENDVLHYEAASQAMVRSGISGIAAPVISSLSDKSDVLSQTFINNIANRDYNIDEVFDGSFEGAGSISRSDDSKLVVSPTDSMGVRLAKLAMKATLLYTESKTEALKSAATNAVNSWISSSSATLLNDLTSGSGSYASRFAEYSGYSRSQWNEYVGNTFIRPDIRLA